MNVSGNEAGERRFHIATGDGEGQLPIRGVFDAVNTTGQDAVVHTCFAGDGAQQRCVGSFALEGQAYDATRYMSEIVALLTLVDLLVFLHKTLGGRVLGVQEYIGHRALLNDHPRVHHCHFVTHATDNIHLVGDQHDGQLQLTVDLGQQLQHRGGGLRVEGAGGFVAQQHFWLGGQRTGNAHTLFLAA